MSAFLDQVRHLFGLKTSFVETIFCLNFLLKVYRTDKGIEFLSQMPPLWIKQVGGPNKCTHLVIIVLMTMSNGVLTKNLFKLLSSALL